MKGENGDKNEERKMFYDTIEEERNKGLGTVRPKGAISPGVDIIT